LWRFDLDQYKDEVAEIKSAKAWINTHVAEDIFNRACPLDESIDNWYANLEACIRSQMEDLVAEISRKYHTALTPMTKNKTEAWITRWEAIRTQIDARNVPEFQNPAIWLGELSDAIRPAYPEWAVTARNVHLEKLRNEQESWRDVSNALRTHTRTPASEDGRKRGRGQAHASFPAYNDEASDDQKEKDKKKERGGRKRRRTDNIDKSKWCPICELGVHALKGCWYGPGANRAPKFCTPRDDIKTRAEQNLKKLAIKQLIEKARKQVEQSD
jgi:hypothetical protein